MKTDKTICLNSKVGGGQPSLQDRIYDVEGCSTAITTSFLPNIAEPIICAMRGGNPDNPRERAKSNGRYRQRLEMNDKGTSNTITSVQKDNLVVEPQIIKVGNYSPSGHNASSIVSTQGIAPAVMENHGPVTAIREPQVLTPKRTEFGKAIRKQDDSLAVMEGYNKEGCVQVGNIYPDSENMTNRSGGRVYSNTGCSPTILSRDFKQPKMIMEEPKIATMHYRIRKLTPRECFRLMGVDDADIDKLMNASISNSQLYKCAGNSIVVDVLYHIFRKLYVDKECEQENYQQTLF